jgi:hypothetical protein
VHAAVRHAILKSRPEYLKQRAVEAVDAVSLRAEPKHALLIFVNRENPVAFSVLGDWVVFHRLSVVTPNHATEICHPQRAVVSQRTRYKDLVVALFLPAYVADTILFLYHCDSLP